MNSDLVIYYIGAFCIGISAARIAWTLTGLIIGVILYKCDLIKYYAFTMTRDAYEKATCVVLEKNNSQGNES